MKYVVEISYIADAKEVGGKGNLIGMWTESGPAGYYITDVPEGVFPYIHELDDNYINQHFGHMQDESFCAGFELARRISTSRDYYKNAFYDATLSELFGTCDYTEILAMNPLEVEEKVEAYEAEQARVKAEKAKEAEATKAKEAQQEAMDKAAAKAVETFRKLGANYVQIAQAVTKAMAEAVEAES